MSVWADRWLATDERPNAPDEPEGRDELDNRLAGSAKGLLENVLEPRFAKSVAKMAPDAAESSTFDFAAANRAPAESLTLLAERPTEFRSSLKLLLVADAADLAAELIESPNPVTVRLEAAAALFKPSLSPVLIPLDVNPLVFTRADRAGGCGELVCPLTANPPAGLTGRNDAGDAGTTVLGLLVCDNDLFGCVDLLLRENPDELPAPNRPPVAPAAADEKPDFDADTTTSGLMTFPALPKRGIGLDADGCVTGG